MQWDFYKSSKLTRNSGYNLLQPLGIVVYDEILKTHMPYSQTIARLKFLDITFSKFQVVRELMTCYQECLRNY